MNAMLYRGLVILRTWWPIDNHKSTFKFTNKSISGDNFNVAIFRGNRHTDAMKNIIVNKKANTPSSFGRSVSAVDRVVPVVNYQIVINCVVEPRLRYGDDCRVATQ